MRISINVAHHTWPEGPRGSAAQLERVVTTADEIGLDTVWVADRLLQTDPNCRPDDAMLEAYTTLGFLASRSERVRLGAMAGAVTYRAPALLVKAVTTLDVLSGGRARLGVSAGYAEHEAAALGLLMPAAVERFEHVEDLLRLARQMWAGDDSPFHGVHTELARPHTQPLPLSTPHPPILIAGNGESRLLPLVARYADAFNLLDVPHGGATLRRKLDILAVHCRKAGRSAADIDTSVSTRLRPEESADELVAHCRHFATLGIEHVVLVPSGPWTQGAMSTLAAAAPAIHGLRREPEPAAKIVHLDAHRVAAVGIPV